MSLRAMITALDYEGLTPTEKLVLVCYADHADDEGRCWPSQARVASRVGCARETVNKCTRSLQKKGAITVSSRRRDDGGKSSNSIKINPNTPCDEKSQGMGEMVTGHVTPGSQGVCDAGSQQEPPSKEPPREKKARASKARPADVSEVIAYAETRGISPSDAEAFWFAKEGNGWRNGSNPVRDWRATLCNWDRNGWLASQKGSNGQPNGQGFRSPTT